jgi:hypothetical protein
MICARELHPSAEIAYPHGMTVLAENISYLFHRFQGGQEAFADHFDVSQGTVSRWMDEDKPSQPKPETIIALAEFARVTPHDLMHVHHERWGRRGSGLPSAAQLTEMIVRSMTEMEPGIPPHEWPRAFAAALHTRLERFADDATSHDGRDDRSGEKPAANDGPPPPTN